MGIDEHVVKLLGLEMKVARRGYHAKDHEGVPHEGIRRASVDDIREFPEVQEVEGLHGGLAVEEVLDTFGKWVTKCDKKRQKVTKTAPIFCHSLPYNSVFVSFDKIDKSSTLSRRFCKC